MVTKKSSSKANLRKHELLGLAYQFVGATSMGIGVYYAAWFAVRPLYYETITALSSREWVLFPLFFGLGVILLSLGSIELKEALPAHRRK